MSMLSLCVYDLYGLNWSMALTEDNYHQLIHRGLYQKEALAYEIPFP